MVSRKKINTEKEASVDGEVNAEILNEKDFENLNEAPKELGDGQIKEIQTEILIDLQKGHEKSNETDSPQNNETDSPQNNETGCTIELSDLDLKDFDELVEESHQSSDLNELTKEQLELYYKTVGLNINKKTKDTKIIKLILHNFMTFQNSTVDFHEGFNVITGPNGSGKSVIFQAIKFVLGSNEKDDRYTNWAGFIRDGTDYCSVEVHIKSSEGTYILKRRVVRDGTIEYFLGKGDPKNLKKKNKIEIAKLISELGFEPDNKFCFIAQGNINSIWNQTPQEIAKIIEDGINLSDFRKRILTEIANVKELQNRKKELETKRSALESELITLNPKYERYLKKLEIQKRLKELNVEKTWAKRDSIEKELRNQEEIIKEKDKFIQIYQNQKNEIEQKFNENKEEINAIEQAIEDIMKEINKLDSEINIIKSQIEAKSSGVGSIREKIEKNNVDIKNYARSQQSIEKQIENETNNANQIQDLISKHLIEIGVNEKNESVLSMLEEKSSSLKNKNFELNAKIDHLEKDLATKNERLKKIKSEINKLHEKATNVEKDLNNSSTYNRHKDYINNIGEILKNKIKQSETRAIELKNRQIRVVDELNEKKKELQTLQEIASLNAISDRMTKFIEEINRNHYDLIGPLGQFLEFDEKYRNAISILITPENFNAFMTENSMVFNNAYRILKQTEAIANVLYFNTNINENPRPRLNGTNYLAYGAEILKINAKEPKTKEIIQKAIKYLIGSCVFVENIAQLWYFIKENPDYQGKIIDLEGNLIEISTNVSIANYGNSFSVLEQRKSAIHKIPILEKKIKELENENLKISQEKKTVENEIVTLKTDLNLSAALTKKVKELEDINKKKEKNETERENLISEIGESEAKLAEIRAEKETLQKELNKYTQGTEYEKENLQFLEKIPSLIKQVRMLIDEKRKKIEELNLASSQTNQKLAQNREKLRNIIETLERLENNKKSLENEIQTLDADTKRYINEQIAKNESMNKKKKELDHYKQNKNDLENSLESLNKKNLEISGIIVGLKKDNEILVKKIEETRNLLEEINAHIEQSNVEKIGFREIEMIERDIENTESELMKYRDCGEDIAARKHDVDLIIKEISSKNREIHDEIIKGEQTIQTLKTQHLVVFKIAIKQMQNKVNEKFEKTNTMLRIKIKDQGDFDTLGVHIGVKDTSKNYRNIKAISGGQRTMVALGIILTIQESNPTPLNMFDEADTHLDAKNGNTIYSLMKQVSENVQIFFFIPISDKPYIALSDKIIGITSQGEGFPSVIVYYNYNSEFFRFIKKQKELEEKKKNEKQV